MRIRKSSLEKELKKQKEIIKQIKEAISNEQKVSSSTVTESAIRRLIGMSVSRVELWNHEVIIHDMCWRNGFQEINSNKNSIKQIKRLDRGRNKLYYKLVKELKNIVVTKQEEKESDTVNELKQRQIIFYDKPFSYYFHVIERVKLKKDTIDKSE